MKAWENVLVLPTATIHETIQKINQSSLQIALVVNQENLLVGTVTDGDIRTGLLKGVALQEPVALIMNPKPKTVGVSAERDAVLAMMRQMRIHQIPLLDDAGRLVGLETLDELLKPEDHDNLVILMAGGLGSRLKPLTDECPKAMLKIGERPVLETILLNFTEYGFKNFLITLNYKADMIRDHFKDGSPWGVQIGYIQENDRMGTAGALGLLTEAPEKPVLVMNGDIMTSVNFKNLLAFHEQNKAAATVCIREISHTIPYGVIKMRDGQMVHLEEKPEQKHFVSAGIYVLGPEAVKHIPRNSYYDMPTLLQELVRLKMPVLGFPIHEYWMDIGHMENFEQARKEFETIFT